MFGFFGRPSACREAVGLRGCSSRPPALAGRDVNQRTKTGGLARRSGPFAVPSCGWNRFAGSQPGFRKKPRQAREGRGDGVCSVSSTSLSLAGMYRIYASRRTPGRVRLGHAAPAEAHVRCCCCSGVDSKRLVCPAPRMDASAAAHPGSKAPGQSRSKFSRAGTRNCVFVGRL